MRAFTSSTGEVALAQQELGTEAERRPFLFDGIEQRATVRSRRAGRLLERAARRPHPGGFDDDAIALATRVDDARLAQHFQLGGRGGDGFSRGVQRSTQDAGQIVAVVGGLLRRAASLARNGQDRALDGLADGRVADLAGQDQRPREVGRCDLLGGFAGPGRSRAAAATGSRPSCRGRPSWPLHTRRAPLRPRSTNRAGAAGPRRWPRASSTCWCPCRRRAPGTR